ncbi:MAG: glycosyltransferase [Pseudomonadota bacterium]
MRILYYNWVDYLDDEKRGGGVSIYQRNVMAALDMQTEMAATFLSSGLSYDIVNRAPRWEQMRHGPKTDRHRRYEIVNSGVLAPAHHSFGNTAQLDHPATREVFFDFIEKTGPYDVIHFNNLEGVPVDVLTLKRRWPQTRLILTLHNYYPICPQVNLWYQERHACTDFQHGDKCALCLAHKPREPLVRLVHGLVYRLKCVGFRPKDGLFGRTLQQVLRTGQRASRALGRVRQRHRAASEPAQPVGLRGAWFANRRADMIACINAHCDQVLCVSDRVRVIAAEYGISPSILRTSYIGTCEAERFYRTRPKKYEVTEKQSLTLAFLGYMRRDKGFFFLLDALEALPSDLSGRVRVVVAAQSKDVAVTDRLEKLSKHLSGITHIDGYSHATLDEILSGVDVGVIPVLWEDNLPQVAIEMHARHIPLLTSDMGGAQELGNCPDMIFAAGDIQAFVDRIRGLLNGGAVNFDAYWRQARAPQAMAAHLDELRMIYSRDKDGHAVSVAK